MTQQQAAALNALGETLRRHPTPPDDRPRIKPLSADDLMLRKACDSNETEEALEDACNEDREKARRIALYAEAIILGAALEIGLGLADRDYLAGYLCDLADDFDRCIIDHHGMERV